MKRFTPSILVALFLAMATVPSAYAQAGGGQPSSASLDTLLAPIALYPDALIIQIMQCAQSPYQVKQVNDWLKKNPDLKGTAAQDGAQQQGFDASFVAIVLFPQVVSMMADKPDWTQQLGQAFQSDRDAVFDSIQRLRKEAEAVGNLKTTPQQTVQTETTQNGQQVIVIQPANPQVVYVPQYNPSVVYTQPAQSSQGQVAAAGIIGFAAGVAIGAALDNDDHNYYYHYGGWGYHGPALCRDGWNDYYDHRENMANDYYDHRENMADQRGDNRSDRWNQRSDTRDTRQDTRSGNRDTAQNNRSTRQSTRSDDRSSRASNRGATASRGSFQDRSQSGSSFKGMNSGAFSGFQRGSSERASSARGRSSLGGRSGGGGGGFQRGGGGFQRGGGGRGRR